MNIREIDVVSFATRVAYTAAAELAELLDPDGDKWRHIWGVLVSNNDLEDRIVDAGGYVCSRDCRTAEQLFLHLRDRRSTRYTRWSDVPEASRQKMQLFVDVCRETHGRLKGLQDTADHEAEAAALPSPPLKREDSIFEPHGSLAEEDPARRAALEKIDEYDRAKADEAIERKAAEKAAGNAAKAKSARKGAALSAGEAPAGAAKAKSARKTAS